MQISCTFKIIFHIGERVRADPKVSKTQYYSINNDNAEQSTNTYLAISAKMNLCQIGEEDV